MDAVTMETQKGLAQLIQTLDEKNRAMLWHLWWYRHADISDLRALIDAASDFEVLYRLKEVINERALRLRGRPVESMKFSPKAKPASCSSGLILTYSLFYPLI